MKVIYSFVLILVLSAFQPERASKIPSLVLKDLSGKEVQLADFGNNDKLTVISFWATWCKPCMEELDAIAEYYEEWSEKYNLEVIAVSLDDTRTMSRVKPVVDSKEWPYQILLDVNKDSQRAFNFQAPPYLVLVDKEGNIVYKHNGYSPGSEIELEEKLEEMMSN